MTHFLKKNINSSRGDLLATYFPINPAQENLWQSLIKNQEKKSLEEHKQEIASIGRVRYPYICYSLGGIYRSIPEGHHFRIVHVHPYNKRA